jgi:uncharacterized protein with GYD domain
MPKYLLQGKYTQQGVQGLRATDPPTPGYYSPTERVTRVTEDIVRAGGSVDAYYFAFGDVDIVIIADFPDHASVTAFTLAVNELGTTSMTTTVLILPSEVDHAIALPGNVRPPGT